MIITIDTTKDSIDVKDVYCDSELELLERIRKARFNTESSAGMISTLRKAVNHLKSEHAEDFNIIQQIKMVRAITGWGLKESKDFVQENPGRQYV